MEKISMIIYVNFQNVSNRKLENFGGEKPSAFLCKVMKSSLTRGNS